MRILVPAVILAALSLPAMAQTASTATPQPTPTNVAQAALEVNQQLQNAWLNSQANYKAALEEIAGLQTKVTTLENDLKAEKEKPHTVVPGHSAIPVPAPTAATPPAEAPK